MKCFPQCILNVLFTVYKVRKHAHLIRCAASREEVSVIIAMYRHVKDIGVVVERLLGAVAMVNVLRAGRIHMIKSQAFSRSVHFKKGSLRL